MYTNQTECGREYCPLRNVIAFFSQDEKLQDVLGHFQKDFEGGVSAENLGKS